MNDERQKKRKVLKFEEGGMKDANRMQEKQKDA